MKKTYVTTMPDKAGAFLKASSCFAKLNMNITRVSYNKAVDTHTLFIEVEGTAEQFKKSDLELLKIGYITDETLHSNVILLQFKLEDKPGQLEKVLKLIEKYKFNISYINSHENGLGYQPFRMGLFVNDNLKFLKFFADAQKICPVEQINYDNSEKNFDNTIFYSAYVDTLSKNAKLNKEQTHKLTIYVNRAMQFLDEANLSPSVTFDSISKFACLLNKYKGANFKPRISNYAITNNTTITVIEPPCGSNTTIIKSNGKYLFIDSGYAIYQQEMVKLLNDIVGDFNKINKQIILTHADVDHAGLLPLFDTIYASDKSKESLSLEYQNQYAFREQNQIHNPYIKICKLLTHYTPVNPQKIKEICKVDSQNDNILYKSATFSFEELNFDVYCGKGGHLEGEIVLIENTHKIIFSGDIFVNVKGYTIEQAEYNKYAPILMTSVDTNPSLSKQERLELTKIIKDQKFKIFGGHGQMKIINE